MNSRNQPIETLQDIKNIMNRSSRFISLSGLSGVAAGVCALVGAWFAHGVINSGSTARYPSKHLSDYVLSDSAIPTMRAFMGDRLFQIAVLTFIAAFGFSFLFTYLRSRKENIPVWGTAARRLMWNVLLPMMVGGIFLLKLIEAGVIGLIAPGCLIFYGLALINGSKFTLGEIRYLGYANVLLGLINCWYPGLGIYFWAMGFGVLHIVYGVVMWNKYERA
ncbi:MAG: hypothetical protein K2X48_16275 [Chitinophagaceae bacterium]|nr:hypothetical protein [Chitinophagaceae bacterium]